MMSKRIWSKTAEIAGRADHEGPATGIASNASARQEWHGDRDLLTASDYHDVVSSKACCICELLRSSPSTSRDTPHPDRIGFEPALEEVCVTLNLHVQMWFRRIP